MPVPPDQQVLQHCRLLKQLDILERARDPKAWHLIRSAFQQVIPIKANASLRRIVKPRDQIKDRRFTRTVWPDKGEHFTLVNLQGDVVDRHQPAKAQGDVFNFKQAHWTRSVLR